ncbi:hypothetical protein ACRAWD_29745 [Caulobacter segnis]
MTAAQADYIRYTVAVQQHLDLRRPAPTSPASLRPAGRPAGDRGRCRAPQEQGGRQSRPVRQRSADLHPDPGLGLGLRQQHHDHGPDPQRHARQCQPERSLCRSRSCRCSRTCRWPRRWMSARPSATRTTTRSAATARPRSGSAGAAGRGHPGARRLRPGLPGASSILESPSGGRQTSFPGTDLCNGGGDRQSHSCRAARSAGGLQPGQLQPQRPGIAGTISGNTKLKGRDQAGGHLQLRRGAEAALRAGLTVATVDWYQITVKDAIASQSATQILGLCAQRGGVFLRPGYPATPRTVSSPTCCRAPQNSGRDQDLGRRRRHGPLRVVDQLRPLRRRTRHLVSGELQDHEPEPDRRRADRRRAGRQAATSRASTYPHWKGYGPRCAGIRDRGTRCGAAAISARRPTR